jgi:hypothetical protein
MDGHGFDLLTKRLALLLTRRQGLRAVLAGAGAAGLLAAEVEGVGAACGGPGTRCKNGNPCCSQICVRDRKKKGKKSKKGRCDCSFPQEACNVANDCCFLESSCGDNGCDPDNRCCFGERIECIDPCECCDGFTCDFQGGEEFGVCVRCVQLQEACGPNDSCCAEGSLCGDNQSEEGNVCCLDDGFACGDDFDCCGDRRCSSRAENTCQDCAALQEFCNGNRLNCCDIDARCQDNACDVGNVCCRKDGGACEDDCDCCEEYACHAGTKTCQRTLDRQAASTDGAPADTEAPEVTAERARSSASRRPARKPARARRRRR